MRNKFLTLCFLLLSIVGNAFNEEVLQGVFIFKQAVKKENVVLLEFSSNKKLFYFDAAKSDLKPYLFYTTDASGSIITNEKIKNQKFFIRYDKWPTSSSTLYIISLKEVF
ncbi:MAG: hypothetical protein H7178_03075 [Chitinophagaceae bacterium]|nr:hypothetical protein [Chitinophagaceae bacterium]